MTYPLQNDAQTGCNHYGSMDGLTQVIDASKTYDFFVLNEGEHYLKTIPYATRYQWGPDEQVQLLAVFRP